MSFNRRQLAVLVLLTLVWGVNWPILKIGATQFPPLSFRSLSMWLGLPLLAALLAAQRVPFRVDRRQWPELLSLAAWNMVAWHVMAILAVRELSSGRAAILGYTMPVFSAMIGAWFFGERLTPRGWLGIGAAAVGVTLLLWHEFSTLAGKPLWAGLMLLAAAAWAWGTHRLRRTTIGLPTLTLSFWMTAITTLVMTLLAAALEHDRWSIPGMPVWLAVIYNGVVIFAFAQPAWFYLARGLPPLASTLSVMMIPVLGVVSGALALGEVLHWQDYAAIVLLMVAIASVLLPTRSAPDGS